MVVFSYTMILVLTSYWDYSSQELIKCFEYYNFKDFVVLSTPDLFLFDNEIDIANNVLIIGNKEVDFSKIKIVWNRRFSSLGYTDFYDQIVKDGFEKFGFDSIKLKEQLRAEFAVLLEFIYYNLKDKVWYPGFNISNINKMIVLKEASNVGLSIPRTCIVNSKSSLKDEVQYISKSMYETTFIHSHKWGLMDMFTRNLDCINDIPHRFFPSLVQEKIVKKFEIRIFFIDDDFYSMAIFSQNNKETLLDYRVNSMDINRVTSYKIPEEIRTKLLKLFHILKIRTGSVDMILDENNEYILLEINPIGQYGMTSVPCNYNLDFKIAEKLITNYYTL